MNEPKFTSGPWRLGTSKVAIWASDGAVVADAWESNDRADEECEANARLIAAAPDMYKALQKIANGMAFKQDAEGNCYSDARTVALAALSKAAQ